MKLFNKKFIIALVVGLVVSGTASAEYVRSGVNPDGSVIWTNTTTGAQLTCDKDVTACSLTRKAQF